MVQEKHHTPKLNLKGPVCLVMSPQDRQRGKGKERTSCNEEGLAEFGSEAARGHVPCTLQFRCQKNASRHR